MCSVYNNDHIVDVVPSWFDLIHQRPPAVYTFTVHKWHYVTSRVVSFLVGFYDLELWLMIFPCEFNLDGVKMKQNNDVYVGGHFSSKVIFRTHTHTQPTDCNTQPLKRSIKINAWLTTDWWYQGVDRWIAVDTQIYPIISRLSPSVIVCYGSCRPVGCSNLPQRATHVLTHMCCCIRAIVFVSDALPVCSGRSTKKIDLERETENVSFRQ